VVSTLKDRSVFVATPEITFSQLFFPSRAFSWSTTGKRRASSRCRARMTRVRTEQPAWSPDGGHLLFAKAKAYHAKRISEARDVLLNENDVPEFVTERRPFRYDIYKIPFNDGRGGTPEPVEGRRAMA